MKTKQITLMFVLALFLGSITNVHAQKNRNLGSVSLINGSDITTDADRQFQKTLLEKVANGEVSIIEDGSLRGENTMPKNTFGLSAGYSATNDFDRKALCGGLDYERRVAVSESGRTGYYTGIDFMYENIKFNNLSSNNFYGGPKFQVNTAIVPSGEAQLTGGIMAQYGFGDTDNGNSSDSFSGFRGCIYAGVDVHKSEKWAIGLVLPLLIFESLTYKPDFGADFKVDETSLFVGKSPARISVKRKF